MGDTGRHHSPGERGDGGAGGHPSPRPRLIATDLDGTVLRPDRTLSPRTLRVLGAAGAAGTPTVVVTARPRRFVRALGLTGIAVALCSNGALVCDPVTGEVFAHHPLDLAVGREVAAGLAATVPGLGFALETGDGVLYGPGFTPRFSEPPDAVEEFEDAEALWECPEQVLKLMAFSSELDSETLLEAARAVAGERAQCTFSGGRGLVEISAPGVTKASALAAWCAERGIGAHEVIAFGDMPNDLPLLAWAGQGWAVGSGHPGVLAAVERHTPPFELDGVASVLEPLFGLEPPPAERTRAVVLDFFGTLVPAAPAGVWEEMAERSAVPLGIPAQRWRAALDASYPERITGALGGLAQTLGTLARRCGTEPDAERIAAAVAARRAAQDELFVPRPDALRALAALREAGTRVGVLSDCSAELADAWERLPFAAAVDARVLSCEEGRRKPDPALFAAVCGRLGVTPGECLYVGDGGGDELAGAARAGMTAVLLAAEDRVPGAAGQGWGGLTVSSLSEVPGLAALREPGAGTRVVDGRCLPGG